EPTRDVQHVCELRAQELPPGATGAVEDQHGVRDLACRVAGRLAEREVVDLQVRQRLTGAELEVLEDEVALAGGCRRGGRGLGCAACRWRGGRRGGGRLGGGPARCCTEKREDGGDREADERATQGETPARVPGAAPASGIGPGQGRARENRASGTWSPAGRAMNRRG